ncbi:MAG: hypothetical protein DBY25_07765 [Clostridiales bacterium]|nr:MAG: hypothetical protein DBY25_07765 [Clostridiales bacterium]
MHCIGKCAGNAVNACREILPEQERNIHLTAVFQDGQPLIIKIKNPCPTPFCFNGDGFPLTHKRKGHSIELKSIDAI